MTDYRVKGAFFENIKDSGPAFTGFVEIDGVKTSIALWPKTSAQGKNYLQVSEDKKKGGPQHRPESVTPPSGSPFKPRRATPPTSHNSDINDMDDDIPF